MSSANELVAGLKEGKGTAGMLLRDETLADQVRQAVTNLDGATSELKSAAANVGGSYPSYSPKDFPRKSKIRSKT